MLRVPKKKPRMGRLVEPELTASQREDLKREFDQIFHSDRPEQRERFLDAVDLLLNEYRASIEPSTDYLLGGRLDELLRHAEPFAGSVEQFNEDEINLIEQEFLIAARANGISYPQAKEEAANAVVA